MDISRFSSINKLLRTTSRVLRFIENTRARVDGKKMSAEEISAEEMERAERLLIKDAQSTVNEKNDACLFKNLGLFNAGGILRCKGRLGNSDLDPGANLPILIPAGHVMARLIPLQCHEIEKNILR